MREWITILIEYSGIYFLWANIIYAVMFLLAFLAIKRRSKRRIDFTKLPSVSFLIPSFNEEALIVETIQTYFSHQEIKREVIVIDDGSKDATLKVLKNFYQLQLTEEHENLKIYNSISHPGLKVIGIAHKGKAEALNIGLKYATNEIVCTMDADTIPNYDGVIRCLDEIRLTPNIIAVGGIITPLNEEQINENHVVTYSKKSWFITQQRLEYIRSFVCERLGQNQIQGIVLISGAMAMFRREALLKVNGFPTRTVSEDFDVVMKLRRRFKQRGIIKIIPVHTGWTQVPKNCVGLTKQRSRWQMGLIQVLSKNFSMIFNPVHGTAGVLIVPYLWIFEVFSPIVELSSYVLLPFAWSEDLLHLPTVLKYFVSAIAINLFITMAGLYLDQKYVEKIKGKRYFLFYLWTAFTSFFGYKQFLSFVRFIGMVRLTFKKSSWGSASRESINYSPR